MKIFLLICPNEVNYDERKITEILTRLSTTFGITGSPWSLSKERGKTYTGATIYTVTVTSPSLSYHLLGHNVNKYVCEGNLRFDLLDKTAKRVDFLEGLTVRETNNIPTISGNPFIQRAK